MKYFLDTHVLLWSLFDTPKLSKSVKEIILDDQVEVFSMGIAARLFFEIQYT